MLCNLFNFEMSTLSSPKLSTHCYQPAHSLVRTWWNSVIKLPSHQVMGLTTAGIQTDPKLSPVLSSIHVPLCLPTGLPSCHEMKGPLAKALLIRICLLPQTYSPVPENILLESSVCHWQENRSPGNLGFQMRGPGAFVMNHSLLNMRKFTMKFSQCGYSRPFLTSFLTLTAFILLLRSKVIKRSSQGDLPLVCSSLSKTQEVVALLGYPQDREKTGNFQVLIGKFVSHIWRNAECSLFPCHLWKLFDDEHGTQTSRAGRQELHWAE